MGNIQVDGLYDQNGDPVVLPVVLPTNIVYNYTHAGAAVDNLTFAGLNGDAAGGYKVVFAFADLNSESLLFTLNADVTDANYLRRYVLISNAGVISGGAGASRSITPAGDTHIYGAIEIGPRVPVLMYTLDGSSGGGSVISWRMTVNYAAAANITSIKFSTTTARIAAGDRVIITKRML
jgi:hypothetical protein